MPKEKQQYHYFAASAAEWLCKEDLPQLLRIMKKAGFAFFVFYVPKPIDAHYKIEHYCPQVNGAVAIYQSKDDLIDIGAVIEGVEG